MPVWKPVAEINDHAGEETSFGKSQQEADDVELRGVLDESHHRRKNPPRDDDACEPLSCAPAFDGEVTGDLENEIADKENAGAEPEDLRIEAEVARHFESGISDIHSIDERNDEKQDKERQKTTGHPADRALFE